MPTTSLQVAYRPLRPAFLVRDRSRNDLREALRLAACLWGGRFAPIFAATTKAEILDAALLRFRADALHATTGVMAAQDAIERNPRLRCGYPDTGIVAQYEQPRLEVIDLEGALTLWPARERVLGPRMPALPSWDSDDPYGLVYAATFGDLQHEAFGPSMVAAFVLATGAEAVGAAAAARSVDFHIFPIDTTTVGLQWALPRYTAHDLPGLFVGNAGAVKDVRAFWNVRAAGYDVLFWDSSDPDGGPFAESINARIRHAAHQHDEADTPTNFRSFECFVVATRRVWHPDLPVALATRLSEANLRALCTSIVGDTGITDWSQTVYSLAATDLQDVIAHTEDIDDERSRVVIQLPRTPFRDRDISGHQACGIYVRTYTDAGYRGTLRLPFLPDLDTWYSNETRSQVDGVRVGPEGFSVLTQFLGPTLDVLSVSPRRLLGQLFERAGLSLRRSLPGEAAWHLLSQFGPYVSVLRLPGVRQLLTSSDARRGISRGHARQMIGTGFEEAADLFIARRLADAAAVWDVLLQRRIFLPGMEIECAWCRHASFIPLRDLDDDVRCPKCGRTFAAGPAIERDPVRFRITGLLEEHPQRSPRPRRSQSPELSDVGQSSSVPVLLTLLFLREWIFGGEALLLDTSNELKGVGIEDCETDFVALTYGRRIRPHTHLLLGECKGRGEVDQADAAKLMAARERLLESGIDCDLVFSTTRQSFTQDEMALFAELHEQSSEYSALRTAPILLTGDQLGHSRYSSRSGIDNQFQGEPGFNALVLWSTRKYFPEPPSHA
jgi:hypothetical protein